MSEFKVLKEWEGHAVDEVVDSSTFPESVTEEVVAGLVQDGTLEIVIEETDEEKAVAEAAAKEVADKEAAEKEAAEKEAAGIAAEADKKADQVDSGTGASVLAPERHPLA